MAAEAIMVPLDESLSLTNLEQLVKLPRTSNIFQRTVSFSTGAK